MGAEAAVRMDVFQKQFYSQIKPHRVCFFFWLQPKGVRGAAGGLGETGEQGQAVS